jgi:hypothetical protein
VSKPLPFPALAKLRALCRRKGRHFEPVLADEPFEMPVVIVTNGHAWMRVTVPHSHLARVSAAGFITPGSCNAAGLIKHQGWLLDHGFGRRTTLRALRKWAGTGTGERPARIAGACLDRTLVARFLAVLPAEHDGVEFHVYPVVVGGETAIVCLRSWCASLIVAAFNPADHEVGPALRTRAVKGGRATRARSA